VYRVATVMGIAEKQPGYKHILSEPRASGGLTYAKASVGSMYGYVESGWKLADGKMALHVEVPANTTATVRLPKAKLEQASEGGKSLTGRADLSGARQAGDDVVVEVGSGKYEFESALPGGK